MIEEHHLEIRKTARYCLARPKDEVKHVLFVIHGYRQLASYFIRRFEELTKDGILVVAPEGLHRFYIEGYSGRVGASWMTKEDRLTDIHDYVHYLNHLRSSLDLPKVPVSLLGFSQGGPTACRWLAKCPEPFHRLILHSTVFPNDFDFDSERDRLAQMKCVAIFGDEDQFADEATISAKMKWMNDRGVEPELLRFTGGHEVHLASVRDALSN